MHLFHGNEHHVHVVYTERTTTYAFVRQTVCLGYTSGLIKQYNKRNFFRLEVWFLINQSINQSVNRLFKVSNSRYKPELQERSETANISSIGI